MHRHGAATGWDTIEGRRLTRAAAAEVAAGLAHAHAQGVVHRDLKPANLLRTPDGSVKIADFGIARAVEETRLTQIGTVLGTLRYLAPEQADGREVGAEADVYSLGVVLAELLDLPSSSDRELVERCLRPDPRDRPTAQEVASALSDETLVEQTRVLHTPGPSTTRRRGVVVALVALALPAIALAFALTRSNSPDVQPVRHATRHPRNKHGISPAG